MSYDRAAMHHADHATIGLNNRCGSDDFVFLSTSTSSSYAVGGCLFTYLQVISLVQTTYNITCYNL